MCELYPKCRQSSIVGLASLNALTISRCASQDGSRLPAFPKEALQHTQAEGVAGHESTPLETHRTLVCCKYLHGYHSTFPVRLSRVASHPTIGFWEGTTHHIL